MHLFSSLLPSPLPRFSPPPILPSHIYLLLLVLVFPALFSLYFSHLFLSLSPFLPPYFPLSLLTSLPLTFSLPFSPFLLPFFSLPPSLPPVTRASFQWYPESSRGASSWRSWSGGNVGWGWTWCVCGSVCWSLYLSVCTTIVSYTDTTTFTHVTWFSYIWECNV